MYSKITKIIICVLLLLTATSALTGCQKAAKPATLEDAKEGDFIFTRDFPDKDLLENIKQAVTEIGMTYEDIDGFYVGPDWANGKRFSFQYGDNGTVYYIYVNQDKSIESINYETLNLKVYLKGYEPYNYKEVENNPDYYLNITNRKELDATSDNVDSDDDTSIILTDGETGDYGQETDDGIVHFTVPAGHYIAESLNGNVKIAQVNVDNEDDYSFIAEFSSIGETSEIDVKDGYYLELTVYGQVKLTKIE